MITPALTESENAARTWRLQFDHAPDFARVVEVAAPLVTANLGLGADLFEPLTVTVRLATVDLSDGLHEGTPPASSWCLEVERPRAPERGWSNPATRVTAAAIDGAALEGFLAAACRQPAAEGLAISLAAMWVRSVRARLPEPWASMGDRLVIHFPGGLAELRVEHDARGAWVVGPDETLWRSPITTYGFAEGNRAELSVAAHWSPWYEEGAAGTLAIEAAIAKLEARGWRRTP